MLDFFKFVGYFLMGIALIVIAIIAAPTMWEQATTDKGGPHSGATPDCPSWDVTLEEGMERAEAIRSYRLSK